MRRLSLTALFSLIGIAVCWSSGSAADETRTEQANKGTVAIMTGEFGGSDVRIAADLSAVLDEGDILRVLPVLGKGSLKNVNDLFYLRGIDLEIVQSDAGCLPFGPQCFDLIVSHLGLNNFEDAETALSDCARVAKAVIITACL